MNVSGPDCYCITHNLYTTPKYEIKILKGGKMASNGRDSLINKIIINNDIVKEINTSKLSILLYFTTVNVRPTIGREAPKGE
jgi:hypothetical protein